MPVAPKVKHDPRMQRRVNPRSLASRALAVTNVPLLLVTALLVAFGLVVVYSVVVGLPKYSFSRQLSGAAAGLVVMCVLWRVDYRKMSNLVFPLLVVIVVLTLSPLAPVIGTDVNGARSWITVFGQQFQPAEFAKVAFILYAAALVARYRGSIRSGSAYLKVLGLLLVPTVCIMAQPDLGTGMVLFIIGMVVLFTGGANRRWLAVTAVVVIVAVVFCLWFDGVLDAGIGRDVFIKDYQKNRLLVFLNENIDPQGISYNLRQSKIAIGSGGLLGKGLGNATQSGLGFLPEAPTDFIFCALAEQFGFLGSLTLIGMYVALLTVALHIAFTANNLYGTLIVSGAMGMWVFQVFENIGMTCGLMPITGIPLPFVSYGSSFLIVNFAVVGLLCSVWAHRDTNKKRG